MRLSRPTTPSRSSSVASRSEAAKGRAIEVVSNWGTLFHVKIACFGVFAAEGQCDEARPVLAAQGHNACLCAIRANHHHAKHVHRIATCHEQRKVAIQLAPHLVVVCGGQAGSLHRHHLLDLLRDPQQDVG